GGGARGLAHLGVLCALEQEKISFDLLAGTSMGALVGGMYALTPRCDFVVERFRHYLESKEFQKTNPDFLREPDQETKPTFKGIFHRFATFIKKGVFYSQSLTRKAPISEEDFNQNISFLLDPVDMEKTQVPLAVVALDLKTGEEVVLREGSLQKAVCASCAIPGILPPVMLGERYLVDGGWINRVPIGPVRKMGADFAIAVDVAEGVNESLDFETGLDIVLRTNEITQHSLSQLQMKEADIIIRPDLAGIRWSDFHRLEDCLRAGEGATKEKADEIRGRIRRGKMKKAFSFRSGRSSS
ncbi:MAG TPA: patatin-like phospholipase family protein, partial [Thermodesulfobacteriota bacterium]|nr:patatin-like phospholipase family protein [Thermodesulfobacteriota bacterium]